MQVKAGGLKTVRASDTFTFTYRVSGAPGHVREEATCRHRGEPSPVSCSPAERQGGRREKPQHLRHPPCAPRPAFRSKTRRFLCGGVKFSFLKSILRTLQVLLNKRNGVKCQRENDVKARRTVASDACRK